MRRTLGTSIYSAGVEQVMEHFNISQTVAILGISLYSEGIGMCTSMSGWSPGCLINEKASVL